jgi:hypothetical protein
MPHYIEAAQALVEPAQPQYKILRFKLSETSEYEMTVDVNAKQGFRIKDSYMDSGWFVIIMVRS